MSDLRHHHIEQVTFRHHHFPNGGTHNLLAKMYMLDSAMPTDSKLNRTNFYL